MILLRLRHFLTTLILALLCPLTYGQVESKQTILEQISSQFKESLFETQDTLRSKIRVFNYSTIDSLYQVQFATAQINRVVIDGVDTLYAGRFIGRDKLKVNQHSYFLPINFKSESWTNIDIKSYNLSDSKFSSRITILKSDQLISPISDWILKNSRGAFVNIFFIGSVIALLLYFGMLSILSPRRDFIIYAGYLFFVLMHYSLTTDTNMHLGIFFPNKPIYNILVNEFTLNMMYTVYIYFAMQFLDVKKYSKFLTKYLTFEAVFHLCLAIFFTSYLLGTKNINFLKNHLYDLYLLAFLLSVIAVVLIYFLVPGRIKYFVIIGSLFLSIASLLEVLNDTFMFRWFEHRDGPHRFLSYNVTQVGIFLELICFSLGIGFKHNRAFKDKEAAQASYIDQLKKNQELQNKYTNELQKEVEVQADELLKEKERGLKTGYENRIMQLESDMLHSQMNPHFIFNSLNSIKYFALTQPSEATASYITDFSKLMRMILRKSRESKISLSEEIEFIKLYLQIESRRYENKFTYDINIEDSLDYRNVYVPSMLIQPLVENAIVHGLFHKEKDGLITVNFSAEDDLLFVEVEDNGIGRVAAEAMKQRSTFKKSSLGNSITLERLALLNQMYDMNATIEYDDLYDDNNEASGTRIKLKLPLSFAKL